MHDDDFQFIVDAVIKARDDSDRWTIYDLKVRGWSVRSGILRSRLRTRGCRCVQNSNRQSQSRAHVINEALICCPRKTMMVNLIYNEYSDVKYYSFEYLMSIKL
jgi:hypothetical protein